MGAPTRQVRSTTAGESEHARLLFARATVAPELAQGRNRPGQFTGERGWHAAIAPAWAVINIYIEYNDDVQ